MRHARVFLAAIIWFTTLAAAGATPRNEVNTYVFGNSLIHHATDDPQTSVPHWLNELAKADGTRFAVDGQWGFLRNFAQELPPRPNWSFPGVRTVWDTRRSSFASAGFDTIMLNPANFIQYQPPDRPYDGDNPGRVTPLGATLSLLDWVGRELPQARFLVYEGWADMATVTSYPPSNRGLRKYHRFNQGDYHDWYVDFVDRLRRERPELDLRLVPVASVLSTLLTSDPLSDIPATALYSDDAPHGTASLYFLAAIVTYAAMYEKAPPPAMPLPDAVHPIIRDSYPAISRIVWALIQPTLAQAAAASPAVDRKVAEDEPAPIPDTAPAPNAASPIQPAGGVPQLAMGLDGISDWSTQHPFVNVMKTARPWIGHLDGQFGGVDIAELRAGGHLTPDGWPISLPPGVTKVETLVMTDQPQENSYLAGRWMIRWKGAGRFTLSGRATNVVLGDGEGAFDFVPGDGGVVIGIDRPDPSDPVRDIAIFREDQLPLFEAGVLFNPVWIDRVKDLRTVRVMDWMLTNGSPITTWNERPRPSDWSYAERGVPVEVIVALANQIGVDPWVNMPHAADDDYVRRFAETLRDGLDPRRKVYVEYSNEMWNFIFPQTVWAQRQARALWGEAESDWVQFYGYRAAQVMQIWSDVFAGQTDRIVRVAAVHTGWPGLEEAMLSGPDNTRSLGAAPSTFFDAYAVTGYFGHEIGDTDFLPRLQAWLDEGEAQAARDGAAQGLEQDRLRDYVAQHRFDRATERTTQALRDGALRELTEELFPHHARAARSFALDLVMYEGGTHVTGLGDAVNDDRLTQFFTTYNYSDDMTALYDTLLERWTDAGGHMFNGFVDVAKPSKWGSWGHLRHLNDRTGRWESLMRYNATLDGPDWQGRSAADFVDGARLQAGAAPATLAGTPLGDVLIGGPGDDTLICMGGDDHVHGGGGYDIAELPLGFDAYSISLTDTGLVLRSQGGTVQVAAVEALGFSDGIVIEIAALTRHGTQP